MPLSVGDKLGHYEVLSLLGQGGMGEVYRARDTKLKRDVAIKVLPEAFARDSERMARFQREAEVLASLNHPNIATIHGVEERALVMELVEGNAPKGPLPFDEAWKIASQIVAALEYAHERGIMHRDLKPANIMITSEGVVKLLDFGLAKAFSNQRESSTSPENSPTLTRGATEVGVILGTAAYMAPEQARGKAADKRADIWSFGVVLYELLTGKRLFGGETISDTLAQVLTKEPDLLQAPPQARRLLRRCLEKDPKQRLRDIGEARFLLEDAPAEAASRPKLAVPWMVAAAVLAAVAAGGWWIAYRATRPVDHPLMRLSVDLGPDAVAGVNTTVALSPDGTLLVFPVRGSDGKQRLTTRPLDQANASLLAGTENASDPFFSPDGKWVGFFADSKVKKISLQGGAPVTLCDAPRLLGASWGEDGNIIATLSSALGGLSVVPSAGGAVRRLTSPAQGEVTHRWPQILPGGNTVLFTTGDSSVNFENGHIDAFHLKTGQKKTLVRGGYFGRYLPTDRTSGTLVYIHEGTLFGVHFDPVRLELRGTPVALLEDVAANPTDGAAQFDFWGAPSGPGAVVYRSGKVLEERWPVVWLDSSGKTMPLVTIPGTYFTPRFSPDGRRLAVGVGAGSRRDLFVYDWQRDTMSRLTFNERNNDYPIWTADGKHIAFRFSSLSGSGIGWIRSSGGGEPHVLLESKYILIPNSLSPDGRRLAYQVQGADGSFELWTLPLDLTDQSHPKPGTPELFLRTPENVARPAFSPDGRWMAYYSDESGRNEVFVRPFPSSPSGEKWQISIDGGQSEVWSPDGRELFFETLDGHIMIADYTAQGDSFVPGKPRLWSPTPIRLTGLVQNLDVAPDGKRVAVFPVSEAVSDDKSQLHVTFLLNFFDELRRKVPAGM